MSFFHSLKKISPNDRYKFCTNLKKEQLLKLLEDEYLNQIISLFPQEDRCNFCALLGSDYLLSRLKLGDEWRQFFSLFPPIQRIEFCDFLSKTLFEGFILQYKPDLDLLEILFESKETFLQRLFTSPMDHKELLQTFISHDFERLYVTISYVDPKDRNSLCVILGPEFLRSTIKDIDQFNSFLLRFSKASRFLLCKFLGRGFVSSLIDSLKVFENLAWRLKEYDGKFIQWLLPTPSAFKTFLSQIPSRDRIEVCRLFASSSLKKLIEEEPKDAQTIAVALPQKDRFEFFELLGVDVINDHHLLSKLFKHYPLSSLLPEKKCSGPRVAKALRNIAENSVDDAYTFLVWFKLWERATGRHFSQQDIRAIKKEMEENWSFGHLPMRA